MNKDTIIALLKDGAYFNSTEDRFYHPSFRKGYRKMHSSDISFMAAKRVLREQLVYNKETQIHTLINN